MANDAPPTPAAPGLPPEYDPNMGVIAPGLKEPGNLELNGRPLVQNSDGTHSSEYSVSFGTDKGEVLVPTVVDGRFLTPDGKKPAVGSPEEKQMVQAAKEHYTRTGQHLGVFDTPENADAYANAVHNRHLRPALHPDDIKAVGGKTIAPGTVSEGGFLPTLSKTVLGTEHPVDQAESELKSLEEHPAATLGQAAKTAAMLPVNIAYNAVHHPVDTAVGLTGGREFSEAAAKKDIPGMAGAVAGGFINAENPEERGLDPEDIEIAGGKTIVPPTPRSDAHPVVMASPDSFIKKVSDEGSHVYPDVVNGYRAKIRAGEPIEPLEIHHDAEGNVIGANGRHRALAAKQEGVAQVPVRIVKPPAPTDYAAAAKDAGVEFRGVQKGVEGLHPGLAIFQDPKSGTSVAVKLDQWSPEKLQEHIDLARERMAPKKEAATTAAKTPEKNFQVIDTQTGDVMSSHATAKWAHRAANHGDLEHGGVRYTVRQRPNK